MIIYNLAEMIYWLIRFVMLRPIVLFNLFIYSRRHLNMVWKWSLCRNFFSKSLGFLWTKAFWACSRKATTKWLWNRLFEILSFGTCRFKPVCRRRWLIYLSTIPMKGACISGIRIKIRRAATKSLRFHNFLIFVIIQIRLSIFLLRFLLWYEPTLASLKRSKWTVFLFPIIWAKLVWKGSILI